VLVEVAEGKFGLPSKRSDPADCKQACMESQDCGGFMFAGSLANLAEDTCFFFRDAACGLVEMHGSDGPQADCYFIHESGGTEAIIGDDSAGASSSELDLSVDSLGEGEESSAGVFVKEISALRFLSLGEPMQLVTGPGSDVPDGIGVVNGEGPGSASSQTQGYEQAVFIVYAHSDTSIRLDVEAIYPNGADNSHYFWFDSRADKKSAHYGVGGYSDEFKRQRVWDGRRRSVRRRWFGTPASSYPVTQGFHTLHVGLREDGTYLRKLWIMSGDADFIEGNAAFTLEHEGKICMAKSSGFRYARWEDGCEGECDADGDGPGPCNLSCCRETCATYDWCTHFTWFTNNACRLYDKCDTVVDGYEGATHEQIYAKLKQPGLLVPDTYELPTLLLE
jgi:hypothetical protein